MRKSSTLTLAFISLHLAAVCCADEAELDPSWLPGNGDVMTVPFDLGGNLVDRISDIAVAPSGRVYALGTASTAVDAYTVAMLRYLPNGELDPTFSGDGKLTFPLPVPGSFHAGRSVRVQSNGQPVSGGEFYASTSNSVAAICRRFVAGNADTTFGAPERVDGCVHIGTTQANPARNRFGDFEIDSLGRFWVALLTDVDANVNVFDYRLAVARLLPNGSRDESFGPAGLREYEIEADLIVPVQGQRPLIEINAQGRATVVFGVGSGVDNGFAVMHLLDNGDIENGIQIVNPNRCGGDACIEMLTDFDILANGDLLITGNFEVQAAPNSLYAMGMARLNADRDLVQTFGDGGVLTDLFGDVFPGRYATAAMELDGGAIMLLGAVRELGGAAYDAAILRYTANGTPDDTFGGGGRQFYTPRAGGSAVGSDQIAVAAAISQSRPLIAIDYGLSGSQDRDFVVTALLARDLFSDSFE